MDPRTRSIVLVAAGAALALLSLLADATGLGAHPGFGWKQIAGLVAGIAVAGVGARGLRADGGR